MSRKEFISHLETGIAQYFADNDIMLNFHELDDISEHITTQVDHTMENYM
jgi:6-pyruvoyl-tetrahydropterin synthase